MPVSFSVTDCAWGGMCTVGVFCGVQGISAGWGVAGTTHGAGCTACVAGRCVGIAGATFYGDMLVRLGSIWVMLTNVVMCTSILFTTNDLDNVQPMVCCADDGGREHRHLTSLRTDMVCPANSGAFCQQP